jgi:hypothetical protein
LLCETDMTQDNTTPIAVAPQRGHIVAIRRDGQIEAYQLRIGSGGAGQSRLFSCGKHGGLRKTLAAAKAAAKEMGVVIGGPRGGSHTGRRTRLSPTPAAGVRFEWLAYAQSTVLYVVASWRDRHGVSRCTRYSVERHGLQGALDKAIAARISAGAPLPDRRALLRALRTERSAHD